MIILRIAICSVGLITAAQPLSAANAAWVSGKVLASAEADGSGTDAPKHSSLTLLRHNVPGESAVQLAGPDPTDPTRIFAPSHLPAYYLTDAGSQWSSGISTGQMVLSIVETMKPEHGWGGEAYAGAVAAQISKDQYISGLVSQPDLWLSKIPKPTLASASPAHVALSISSFADLGGQLNGLSLWRRASGSQIWEWKASIANPNSSSPVIWNDAGVDPENLYEYAVSINYAWPGGSGAGSLTSTAGLYSTRARSISGPFAASLHQPTPSPTPNGPTALPSPLALSQGWLAYPNPVFGDSISLAFDAQDAGYFVFTAFTLAGELALSRRGVVEKAGRVTASVAIQGLASGVYLVRINIEGKNGARNEMPLRKIAILK